MSKTIMMSLEVLVTVPDDYRLCNDALSEDYDDTMPQCDGRCGSDDARYFNRRLGEWLTTLRLDNSIELVSLDLQRYEEPEELDCRSYPA